MKKTLALMLLLAGLTVEAWAETLTWNGSVGHMTWNFEDRNWSYSARYTDGDAVVFGDTGSGTVTLAVDLSPASVTINSGENYTFTGDGKLTGSMQFTKSGIGTITINTTNNFSGGTLINGGTLVLGNAAALGSGAVTLSNNSSLNLGNQAISNAVTLQGNASIGGGSINGNLNVKEGQTLTLSGALGGTGTIFLADYVKLNLNKQTLANSIAVIGNGVSIDGGTLNASLSVGENKLLTLYGDLSGTGSITLANNAKLDLSKHVVSKEVVLQGSASVFNGTLNGSLTLADNTSFIWTDDSLILAGGVTLCYNAKLNLNGKTLSSNVTLGKGSASISNGTLEGKLIVADNVSYIWTDDSLTLKGGITLGSNASLDLNKRAFSYAITLTGYASIGNGTLNGDLYVDNLKRLSLNGDLSGTGSITLGSNARLDLRGKTLSNEVILLGSAEIGGGTLDSDLVVSSSETLTLRGDLSGSGTIILKEMAKLQLFHRTLTNPVIVQGNASIGGGTLDSDLNIGNYKMLALIDDLDGTGVITLGNGGLLILGFRTLSNNVTLQGDATIGQGSFKGNLTMESGMKLSLSGDLSGTGTIALANNATLDLRGHTLSNNVTLQGDATIGNGASNGTITVESGMKLSLSGDLSGSGTIVLNENSNLSLDDHTLSNNVTVAGNDTQVQGEDATISGKLTLEDGVSTTWFSQTVQLTGSISLGKGAAFTYVYAPSLTLADVAIGNASTFGVYTDYLPSDANEGTLTVASILTAEAGATLNANLVMGIDNSTAAVLDVSATGGAGGLQMGSTVTLKPGSVLLSDGDMKALGALGFMGRYDLLSGVDGLSLDGTTNFLAELGLADTWVKAGDVFANEQFQNPEKDYYLFYSGVNQGGAGGNVGTVYLMQIPEPATGTLSILALSALATRRRRK